MTSDNWGESQKLSELLALNKDVYCGTKTHAHMHTFSAHMQLL